MKLKKYISPYGRQTNGAVIASGDFMLPEVVGDTMRILIPTGNKSEIHELFLTHLEIARCLTGKSVDLALDAADV